MYDVLPELYREVAARIIEQVGRRGYYNGSFDMEWEDVLCHVVLSAVVYRHEEQYPGGRMASLISDIVPVWWEFHTFIDGQEVINNFSFNEMREYIN